MKKILMILMAFIIFSSLASAALDLKFNGPITMTPESPSAGANVIFSVKFIPSGAAVDNLKCTYGIGAAKLGERVFAHINAGAVRELIFNWTAVAGSNKAWFELDPEKKTADENYANNHIEKSFTIAGGGGNGYQVIGNDLRKVGTKYSAINTDSLTAVKPDLIISEISITPATPVTTDKILIKVTCKNVGNGASKQSQVEFKIGGESNPKIFDIASLNPGEITVLQREITLSTPQHYRVTAIADYKSVVTESNEQNNTKYIEFDVEQAN